MVWLGFFLRIIYIFYLTKIIQKFGKKSAMPEHRMLRAPELLLVSDQQRSRTSA